MLLMGYSLMLRNTSDTKKYSTIYLLPQRRQLFWILIYFIHFPAKSKRIDSFSPLAESKVLHWVLNPYVIHMVVPYVVFWGTSILLSIVIQFIVPQTVKEGTLFSTPPPAFVIYKLFINDNHSGWAEVVSRFSFDLHFSNNYWYLAFFSCACWPLQFISVDQKSEIAQLGLLIMLKSWSPGVGMDEFLSGGFLLAEFSSLLFFFLFFFLFYGCTESIWAYGNSSN